MKNQELIYKTKYLGNWVEVYGNRVEFGMLNKILGYKTIILNQIASVESGMMGHFKVIIETTGGKKYNIPTNKKNELKEAIYNAMSRSN